MPTGLYTFFENVDLFEFFILKTLRLWEHAKTLFHSQKMLISWFNVDIGTKNDVGGEFKSPKSQI